MSFDTRPLCPYCSGWFKPGPIKEQEGEMKRTHLCICTRAQGIWWDASGKAHGKSNIEGTPLLNAKDNRGKTTG